MRDMTLEASPIAAERSRLAGFVGVWTGQGQRLASPWGAGGETVGTWTARPDPMALHLLVDYEETLSTGGRLCGHGVMMVDPGDLKVLWFWFDSFGFPPLAPARGAWTSSRLIVDKQTPRGAGRTSWTLDGQRLVQAVSFKSPQDEDFLMVSTMTMRRSADPD